MFQHILVAYDGSADSKKAFETALQLAQLSQAGVLALAVEERLLRLAATVNEMEGVKELANHYYQQCLSAAFLRALQANVPFKSEICIGHAARTIGGWRERTACRSGCAW
jgi:nucleotide-binding universal stress UspA family protein